MSILDFLNLARLLVKYRASFSVSHRQRDTIDLIVADCLDRLEGLVIDPAKFNDIPF
jgi:hypothetical protein